MLVAGVSAYLPLDDEYPAFLELVSHHVSTATVAAGAFAAQQRRAEHLTELDRTKTAFFAGISDQFRTPLSLVLGPVAELRDAAAPGSALRADLELVHRDAQRLRRIVDRCWSSPGCTRGRSTRASSPSTWHRSPPVWSTCSGRR